MHTLRSIHMNPLVRKMNQYIVMRSDKSLFLLMMLAWNFTNNFQLTIAITATATASSTNATNSNNHLFIHNSNSDSNSNSNNYNNHNNINNNNINNTNKKNNNININNLRKHKLFARGNWQIGDSRDLNRIQRRDYYTHMNPYGHIGVGGGIGGISGVGIGSGINNVGSVIYDGNANVHNWHHNYGVGRRTTGTSPSHMNQHGSTGFALGGFHGSKTSATSSSSAAGAASSSSGSVSTAVNNANGGGGGNGNGNAAGSNSAATTTGGGEVMLPKSSFPLSAQEPTCEQLRAMWIFSKRQSRAAEMTNEIPTYRDPFAYNVWEPYYSTTRSMGAVRMLPHYMDRARLPVFGRVISQEPLLSAFESQQQQQRRLAAEGRSGGAGGYRVYNTGLRRPTQYRSIGSVNSGGGGGGGSINSAQSHAGGIIGDTGDDNIDGNGKQQNAPVQGSFQKLKELIWTERAKDLTQQRRAEELAARAAVLKEIANGQNIQPPSYKQHLYSKMESAFADENRAPDMDSGAYQHDGRYTSGNGRHGSNDATGGGGDASDSSLHVSHHKYASHQQIAASSGTSGNGNNKHGHLHRSYGNGKLGVGTGGSASALGIGANGKPVMFNRLMPTSMQTAMHANGYDAANGGLMAGGGGNDATHDYNTGIAKAYPMRGTHFRERNHLLYKQQQQQQQQQFVPSTEYFQRNLRNYKMWPNVAETAIELPLLQQQQQQQQQQHVQSHYTRYMPEHVHRNQLHFYNNHNNNDKYKTYRYDDNNSDMPFLIDYEKFMLLNNGMWKLKDDNNNNRNNNLYYNENDDGDNSGDDDGDVGFDDVHNDDVADNQYGSMDGIGNVVNGYVDIENNDNTDADIDDLNDVLPYISGHVDIDRRIGNTVRHNYNGDKNVDYVGNTDDDVEFELNLPMRYIANSNHKLV